MASFKNLSAKTSRQAAGLTTAMTIALASCVSVLPDAAPPAARYTLSPAEYSGAAAPPVDWSLVIADPGATRAHDTAKIAIMRDAGRIEYLAQGEWADRGPSLLRTALIRSFENTGRILNVGDPLTLPVGDYTLQADIRTFEAVYRGGRPTAAIEIYVRLADRRGRVVAARLFEAREPAVRDDINAIGGAFDAAVRRTLSDIVAWTFETGQSE